MISMLLYNPPRQVVETPAHVNLSGRYTAFLSVVVYVPPEGLTQNHSLTLLDEMLNQRAQYYEIILVSNLGQDAENNWNMALTDLHQRPTLLVMDRSHSMELCMWAGMEMAIGDFLIELEDPSLAFAPETLLTLLDKALSGFDMVSAVPECGQRLTSRFFYQCFNRLTATEFPMDTVVCRVLSRRAINAASAIKDKSVYRKLLYSMLGCKQRVLPVKLSRPLTSRTPLYQKLDLASDILFSFTPVGGYLTVGLSLVFLGISSISGIYALYAHWFTDDTVKGWTTLMAFLSFGFSGLFLVLAVFNKYLSLILRESKTLPTYTIQSIQKL
jgi:polyisoprenyl-phosphate glycosyltransferase